MKRIDDDPELIVAAQHEHNAVAFFDSEAGEIVGCALGFDGDIFEAEFLFLIVAADPEHSAFVRIAFRDDIDDIISKVEVVGIVEFDRLQMAVCVESLFDKLFADEFAFGGRGYLGIAFEFKHVSVTFSLDGNGEKFTSFGIDRYHAVRMVGVEKDAVSGIELFDVLTDLHAESSGYDIIELLTSVFFERNALFSVIVLSFDEERIDLAVFEERSKMVIIEVPAAFDRQTVTGAGDVVNRKTRRRSAHQSTDIDSETLGAAEQERKRAVNDSGFMKKILFLSHSGDSCHFCG